jgi:hypothetical protein
MTTIKSYMLVFVLFASSVFFSQIAMAQSGYSQKLYDSLTLSQIFKIMQKENYDVELVGDDIAINWIIEGDIILITSDEANSINFYTYLGHSDVVRNSLDDANKWNTEYKYSKMYIDRDNDVVFELDLDLTGGVTEARIIDFFKTCFRSYHAWLKYVHDK